MGFMGMNSYVDSDTAADFVANVGDKIAAAMETELKERNSEWNTDGDENVALTFEAIIIPSISVYSTSERLKKVAEKCRTKLRRKLKHKDYSEFWSHYKRMIKSLDKFIKKATW